jgi:hypothetical protein
MEEIDRVLDFIDNAIATKGKVRLLLFSSTLFISLSLSF